MKGRMDRDEDLILFRDLRKRENDRRSSLLHSLSEDSEYDSGKFPLYRIPSGKKEYGLEFLVETQKSDYDWLKTPPATPLFPSLEMEPSAQLVVQKEIPIISQPLTRFAGSDLEPLKPKANSDGKVKQTNSSSKAKLPMRSITPSHNRHRPSIVKSTNEREPAATHSAITNKSNNGRTAHVAPNNTKFATQKQSSNADFLALNLRKSMEPHESQRKATTRGVSPSVRPRVAAHVVELSNGAPPNLRTDQRSTSTTRGRSSNVRTDHRSDSTPRACRQSRSPSPSVSNGSWNHLERAQKNLRTQKEKYSLAAGTNESRAHFVGSKMVEKVVNARKSSINQAERNKTEASQI